MASSRMGKTNGDNLELGSLHVHVHESLRGCLSLVKENRFRRKTATHLYVVDLLKCLDQLVSVSHTSKEQIMQTKCSVKANLA